MDGAGFSPQSLRKETNDCRPGEYWRCAVEGFAHLGQEREAWLPVRRAQAWLAHSREAAFHGVLEPCSSPPRRTGAMLRGPRSIRAPCGGIFFTISQPFGSSAASRSRRLAAPDADPPLPSLWHVARPKGRWRWPEAYQRKTFTSEQDALSFRRVFRQKTAKEVFACAFQAA